MGGGGGGGVGWGECMFFGAVVYIISKITQVVAKYHSVMHVD